MTTPGAAAYWRNGPGSVGEFIERERPDYIASYGEGHGLGLGYLQHTDLYAETLASYTVSLDPANNVALAAPTQGIYRPDWTAADRALSARRSAAKSRRYLSGMEVVDSIDVADIDSEAGARLYHGATIARRAASRPNTTSSTRSAAGDLSCSVMDGGRRINGEESFTLHVARQRRPDPGHAHASGGRRDVRRVCQRSAGRHARDPAAAGKLAGSADADPGGAGHRRDADSDRAAHADGDYMPYYHWAYQGSTYQPVTFPGEPLATFQDRRDPAHERRLHDRNVRTTVDAAGGGLAWQTDGSAQGDYKIFVHVLDADGEQSSRRRTCARAAARCRREIGYPGAFRDTIKIDLSEAAPGHYQVVMGLYDPVTLERLEPTGARLDHANNSCLIGEVEVK